MKKIVSWLLETEGTAAKLYAEASEKFSHNPAYSDFLKLLSNEELGHVELVKSLVDFVDGKESLQPSVTIPKIKREEISDMLCGYRDKIANNGVDTEALIEMLISTELSEFNNYMIYLIELAREIDRSFTPELVNMQGHLNMVKRFIEKYGSKDELRSLNRFPKVWNENILFVDPSLALINFVGNIILDDASLTGIDDGNEAFDMISENYYGAIILEVHLNGINGMELFEKAEKLHPEIKNRTIFVTSDDSTRNVSFFKEKGLKYLIKPVKVIELKDVIHNTILENRQPV